MGPAKEEPNYILLAAQMQLSIELYYGAQNGKDIPTRWDIGDTRRDKTVCYMGTVNGVVQKSKECRSGVDDKQGGGLWMYMDSIARNGSCNIIAVEGLYF